MSWLGRGALGLGLMIAGAAAFGFGLLELAKTGSCSSGGTYLSARPCPSGTGLYIGALIAGVFVVLAGGAVFATRGRPATKPGLPPTDDPLASNPPPLGSINYPD